MCRIEESWTKGDVFVLFRAEGKEFRKTAQNIGGIQMYQNAQENKAFIKMYKECLAAENHHYVTDEASHAPCSPNFKACRHDQSISSILLKKYESASRPDHWNNPDFPVIAIRRRRG